MFFFFGLGTQMISVAENHQGNFHETLGTTVLETRGIRAKNDPRDEGFAECSHDQRSSDQKPSVLWLMQVLGNGFSNISYFHPEYWGRFLF